MFATIHAKERALDRFGIELNQNVIDTIEAKLKNLEASELFVCRARSTMWATIEVDGAELRICYCPTRNVIITVAENTGAVYTKTQMKDHRRKKRVVKQSFYRGERRVS